MDQRKPESAPPEKLSPPLTKWDSIDEANWESFPASDPPAVTSVFELPPAPAPLELESE